MYEALSTFKITLPTPEMKALRTNSTDYASCFPPEQLVTTLEGLKQIQLIEEGDKVITKDGKVGTVTGTTNRPYRDSIYAINTAATMPGDFRSTKDHRIMGIKRSTMSCERDITRVCTFIKNKQTASQCFKKAGNYKNDCPVISTQACVDPEWIEANQLEDGDFLQIGFPTEEKTNQQIIYTFLESHVDNIQSFNGDLHRMTTSGEIKKNSKSIHVDSLFTNDFFRFIGYYLGDGSTTGRDISITLGTHELLFINDIKCIIEEIFGLHATLHYHNTRKCVQIIVNNTTLRNIVVGLVGKGFLGKDFNSLLLLNKQAQLHLLTGLFRADSHVGKQHAVLGLSNRGMIETAFLCLLRNNIIGTLGKGNFQDTHTTQPYTLTASNKTREGLSFIQGLQKKTINQDISPIIESKFLHTMSFFNDGRYYSRITNITIEEYGGLVYDFEVSGDHSFTANNTVVHNCILMRMGDSLDSWKASSNALVGHTAASSGCGIDIADNSSIGDKVRNGQISHSGKLPIMKSIDSDIGKTSQNSRRGSATAFINFFDPEIESIFALKSPRMPVEDRINDLSYGIKMNQLAYDRAKSGGVISLFSTRVAPELLDLLYSNDNEAFKKRYEELEAQELYTSQIDAQDYWTRLIAVESAETSSYYIINIDEANANSPYMEKISQSNICVTGDTKLLTKKYGYIPIAEVVGQTLDCWNGDQWSQTPIFQTSESEQILTVTLVDGTSIKATPYHKWYVNNNYSKSAKMKRTHELIPGDKLIKFDLSPVDHGTKVLEHAYESGFITGDGTTLSGGAARIAFYGEHKRNLIEYFNGYASLTESKSSNLNSDSRVNMTFNSHTYSTMHQKYVVPTTDYCVSSRLSWLAGLLDSDGCLLTSPTGANSIQLTSTHLDMLLSLKLLLQELGVHSTISHNRQPAKYNSLPDGKGGYKEYWCKAVHMIAIQHGGLVQLSNLGYSGHRLILPTTSQQRNAINYSQIKSVTDNGEIAPVYCGTEPINNKLMFNGVLTGNCVEIFQPTKPLSLKQPDSPDIGVCVLTNLNQGLIPIGQLAHYTNLA
ncbi:MAG: LAGLIDADG family homing endonuclease, partial [Campylobacterota bacterium]|nr:LAGLIDADG family homing endonuclease [Campylobacterota bacterium]